MWPWSLALRLARPPIRTMASPLRPIFCSAALRFSAHHHVAAFHAAPKLSILPAGPQHIEGTVNDPASVPLPDAKHGSIHWSFERLLSVALIPLTIAPFAAGSVHPVTDAVLGASTVLHSHIGFQALIIDYIPKGKYPKSAKGFRYGLNAATALVLYGLYEFETNDVGITEGVKRVWKA